MELKNGLTPAQVERFVWLSEELSECIHAINKILRHGSDSKDPTNPNHPGNKLQLEIELSHVYQAANLLATSGDISLQRMMTMAMKPAKSQWFHYEENKDN